jgi:hypothetical protein
MGTWWKLFQKRIWALNCICMFNLCDFGIILELFDSVVVLIFDFFYLIGIFNCFAIS